MTLARERAGRLNALKRHRPADDPAVLEAAQELKAVQLGDNIDVAVDTPPPLSEDQRAQLAVRLIDDPATLARTARIFRAARVRRAQAEVDAALSELDDEAVPT